MAYFLLGPGPMRPARLLLASLFVLGCSSKAPTSESSDVVGGRAEDGYPSFGYLVSGPDMERLDMTPFCGATLIRPDVIVTAAHCIDEFEDGVYAFGTGAVGSSPPRAVKKVVTHPSYPDTVADPTRVRFDIALLFLEAPVEGIEPATIAAAREGCGARHFGYGRTTHGDQYAESKSGERKSAAMCVDFEEEGAIWAHGVDGGTCWGDSGSPLMFEGTSEVMGVLHGAANRTECYDGKSSTYASLHDEIGYIECAIDRALSGEPEKRAPYADLLCHWAEGYVASAVGLAFVDPAKSETTAFDPSKRISRQEFAILLARAFHLVAEEGGEGGSGGGEGGAGGGAGGAGGGDGGSGGGAGGSGGGEGGAGGGEIDAPKDVKPTQAGYEEVRAAIRAGFLSLDEDGNFRPSGRVTRAEALASLAEGLSLEACDNYNNVGLVDYEGVPEELRRSVDAAASHGLVTNFPNRRRLRPTDHATKADVVSFVQRALVAQKKAEPVSSPFAIPGCFSE